MSGEFRKNPVGERHRTSVPDGSRPISRRQLLGFGNTEDVSADASNRRPDLDAGKRRTIDRSLTRRGFLRTTGAVLAGLLAFSQVANRWLIPFRGPGEPTLTNSPEVPLDVMEELLLEENGASFQTYLDEMAHIASLPQTNAYDRQRIHQLNDVVTRLYSGDAMKIRQLQQVVIDEMGDRELPSQYQGQFSADPYRDDGQCPDPVWFLRGRLLPDAVNDRTCFDLATGASYDQNPAVLRRVLDDRNQLLGGLELLKARGVNNNHAAIDMFVNELARKGSYDAKKLDSLRLGLKRYSAP